MECAGELASAGMREMFLLHVIDTKAYADYGDYISPAVPKMQSAAEEKLDKLEGELSEIGVSVRKTLEVGNPALCIVVTAKEENVSLIYMGATARFYKPLPFG
jgi:nucleotide-binding universal stress UspA family protein